MLKKKPQPSTDPDIGTEEEHAYEGAWYRSLKARAAHRTPDTSQQPRQDEPEEPPDGDSAAG